MATDLAALGPRSESWTPARIFMLVAAVLHLALGIIGLLYDQTFPIGSRAAANAGSGLIFGVFETNGWHSLAGLGIGFPAAYFTLRPSRAREVAFLLGGTHVGIVFALAMWDPSTFWLASNGADQFIHTSTAIGGIGSALLTRPTGD